jgi:hypothetical protein
MTVTNALGETDAMTAHTGARGLLNGTVSLQALLTRARRSSKSAATSSALSDGVSMSGDKARLRSSRSPA